MNKTPEIISQDSFEFSTNKIKIVNLKVFVQEESYPVKVGVINGIKEVDLSGVAPMHYLAVFEQLKKYYPTYLVEPPCIHHTLHDLMDEMSKVGVVPNDIIVYSKDLSTSAFIHHIEDRPLTSDSIGYISIRNGEHIPLPEHDTSRARQQEWMDSLK